jgi:hypothetical protein
MASAGRTPDEIEAEAKKFKALIDNTVSININLKQTLNILSQQIAEIFGKYPSTDNTVTSQTVKVGLDKKYISLNNDLQILRNNKMIAIVFITYGPIKRQINLLETKLAELEAESRYWSNSGGLFGNLQKTQVYPVVMQIVQVKGQIIQLLQKGIDKFNSIQDINTPDNVSSNRTLIAQYTRKLYMEIQKHQRDIKDLLGQLMFQGMDNSNLPGIMTQSPVASTNNKLVKLAEDTFKETDKFILDKEEEPEVKDKLNFKDADAELEKYWNDLLPGYGSALEHPNKNRNKYIPYKPKFVRKHVKFKKPL